MTGGSSYTGGTTVESGTLRINNISGSGTGAGDLEVFSGATLTGSGIIGSATTIDDGAALAPGDSTGTLTFTNNLTLSDNSLLNFTLGTTSDAVAVDGDLNLTGQLSIAGGTGFGPGSYVLFTCSGALNFGNLTLAFAPAGYGYRFDTGTPGVVKLVVTQPQIGDVNLTPAGLVMTGSNGPAGGNYYLLSATNLAEPLNVWKRLLTNQFDADGNFSFTNSMNPAWPQGYFRLEVP